jgi:hypothetical protein
LTYSKATALKPWRIGLFRISADGFLTLPGSRLTDLPLHGDALLPFRGRISWSSELPPFEQQLGTGRGRSGDRGNGSVRFSRSQSAEPPSTSL